MFQSLKGPKVIRSHPHSSLGATNDHQFFKEASGKKFSDKNREITHRQANTHVYSPSFTQMESLLYTL